LLPPANLSPRLAVTGATPRAAASDSSLVSDAMQTALRALRPWDGVVDDCVERVLSVLRELGGVLSASDDLTDRRRASAIALWFGGGFASSTVDQLALLEVGAVTVVRLSPNNGRQHVAQVERQDDRSFTLVETQGRRPEQFDLAGPLPAPLVAALQLVVDSDGGLLQLARQSSPGASSVRFAVISNGTVRTDPGTFAAVIDPSDGNRPGMRRAVIGLGVRAPRTSLPAVPADAEIVAWLRDESGPRIRTLTPGAGPLARASIVAFNELAKRPPAFWRDVPDDRAAALVRLRRTLADTAKQIRAAAVERLLSVYAERYPEPYPELTPAQLYHEVHGYLLRARLVSQVPAAMVEGPWPSGIAATFAVPDVASPPPAGEVRIGATWWGIGSHARPAIPARQSIRIAAADHHARTERACRGAWREQVDALVWRPWGMQTRPARFPGVHSRTSRGADIESVLDARPARRPSSRPVRRRRRRHRTEPAGLGAISVDCGQLFPHG
jgi:hypothetical protein